MRLSQFARVVFYATVSSPRMDTEKCDNGIFPFPRNENNISGETGVSHAFSFSVPLMKTFFRTCEAHVFAPFSLFFRRRWLMNPRTKKERRRGEMGWVRKLVSSIKISSGNPSSLCFSPPHLFLLLPYPFPSPFLSSFRVPLSTFVPRPSLVFRTRGGKKVIRRKRGKSKRKMDSI